ncbi:nucleoside 2-deoxyribosyltransferase, partial [Lacticaseibacillus paracasei]
TIGKAYYESAFRVFHHQLIKLNGAILTDEDSLIASIKSRA